MCYKPLQTGMERVKILGDLRSQDIAFPVDFDQTRMENQVIGILFCIMIILLYNVHLYSICSPSLIWWIYLEKLELC